MAKGKSGLGKGLDALFLDNTTEDNSVATAKISQIEPNKEQPRNNFDEEALAELADSIRAHGVIQPLVVRPLEQGGYQIVAGERRWRAARMAGLSEVPVVIRDLDDEQTLEIAIIENLQREDLNLMELALGYQSLMQQHNMTQEQVAAKVGKSRSVVANTVRLLALPESVQGMVRDGELSFGHARALLSLEDDSLIETMAKQVLEQGILVRDIEKMARELKEESKDQDDDATADQVVEVAEVPESAWGDSYHREMELALAQELGRKVRIVNHGKRSTLEVDFYSNEELADLAGKLSKMS